MLVSKSINYTGRVVALKLVTGEEIIARVTDDTDTNLVLKRPLSMVMMAGEEDESQGSVAFAPWMLAIPDDALVSLSKSSIVYVHEARKDAAEQWVTAVGDYEGPRGATMEVAASRGRR